MIRTGGAPRASAQPGVASLAMGIRVFVIDDTDHVRHMLVQMLELSGFEIVGEAASGEEAVATLAKADPQVVVVDYKMPGLDGIETAREIRAHRPDQAIILYTAYLDDTLQKEAAAAGVSLCVGKIEGLTTLERDIRRLAGDLF
jgi:DNA-binding NarL/FixJ family response regulator